MAFVPVFHDQQVYLCSPECYTSEILVHLSYTSGIFQKILTLPFLPFRVAAEYCGDVHQNLKEQLQQVRMLSDFCLSEYVNYLSIEFTRTGNPGAVAACFA